VFGNAGTFVTFRVWPNDTDKLEQRFGNKTLLPKESFINIDKHYAYVSTQWGASTKKALSPFHIKTVISDKPFIFKRDENGKVIGKWSIDNELINKIIAVSKNTYARAKDVAEKQTQKYNSFFSN
jgi:hypothetical protein